MFTIQKIKSDLLARLNAALPDLGATEADLSRPPQKDMGDLAFACFGAAKRLKKAPPAIAAEILEKIDAGAFVAKTDAVGPYVNFYFNRGAVAGAIMRDVLAEQERYGDAPATGRKVMIEYASVNTHKEVHVGHLRNIVLGLAAANLRRAAGDAVIPAYYIGDIGAHVAKWLWFLAKTDPAGIRAKAKGGAREFGKMYTDATQLAESDPEFKKEIDGVLRSLEEHDPEWEALWRSTRDICLVEIEKIFKELGAVFEKKYLESEVEGPGKELVRELLKVGVAKEGERGAIIVDLEAENLGVFLVLKSDGSALYSTKELALAKRKFAEVPDLAESVHIVDNRQSLYFKQLFATLRRLGFDKPMTHLGYEFVTLKEGAMSSRTGNIVAYEDFRDQMTGHAAKETAARHEDWPPEKIKETAWRIAEGAMKFGMLKQDNDRPIVFDIEAALSFDGFTGPYVQYAHARLCSILEKAGRPRVAAVPPSASDEREYDVLRVVADFPQAVADAARDYKPSVLAQYLFDLAQASNDFYRDVPILTAEPADRERRLAITETVRATLARGLGLLGITALREM